MSGGSGGGDPDAGPPPPDPCEMPEPLLDRFSDEVMPALTIGCGGRTCHGGARVPNVDPSDSVFRFWESNNPLDETQLNQNLEEVLRLTNFCNPEGSVLMVYASSDQNSTPIHPVPSMPMPRGTAPYETLLSWIEDSVPVPDMYIPPPPEDAGLPDEMDEGIPDMEVPVEPPPVPCDGIPSEALFDRYDLDEFREVINPMIIQTCAEQAGCHGESGVGGGLYYLTQQDECSRRWNLLVTQWYINPTDLPRSLILTQPLDRDHGGQVVFRGSNDPNYVLLSSWLLSAFE